jgi:hypothetical protein
MRLSLISSKKGECPMMNWIVRASQHKLTYIILLVVTLAAPLAWVIPTYLVTVPGPCRPNLPALWACLAAGYAVPAAVIGALVLFVVIYEIRMIITTKW